MGFAGFCAFEFKFGSAIEFLSAALSLSVSGFVEQWMRKRAEFLYLFGDFCELREV